MTSRNARSRSPKSRFGAAQCHAGLVLVVEADLGGDLPPHAEPAAVAIAEQLGAAPLAVAEEVGDLHRPAGRLGEMSGDDRVLMPEAREGRLRLPVECPRRPFVRAEDRRRVAGAVGAADLADQDGVGAQQVRQLLQLSVHLRGAGQAASSPASARASRSWDEVSSVAA